VPPKASPTRIQCLHRAGRDSIRADLSPACSAPEWRRPIRRMAAWALIRANRPTARTACITASRRTRQPTVSRPVLIPTGPIRHKRRPVMHLPPTLMPEWRPRMRTGKATAPVSSNMPDRAGWPAPRGGPGWPIWSTRSPMEATVSPASARCSISTTPSSGKAPSWAPRPVLLLTNDSVQGALFKTGAKTKAAVKTGVDRVKERVQQASEPSKQEAKDV
jgi:hypothetical protein